MLYNLEAGDEFLGIKGVKEGKPRLLGRYQLKK
jgi:hypothetical protein